MLCAALRPARPSVGRRCRCCCCCCRLQLVTGQNHQSAAQVAKLVLEALSNEPAGPNPTPTPAAKTNPDPASEAAAA